MASNHWFEVEIKPPKKTASRALGFAFDKYEYIVTVKIQGEEATSGFYRDAVKHFPPEYEILMTEHRQSETFECLAGNKAACLYRQSWDWHGASYNQKDARKMARKHALITGEVFTLPPVTTKPDKVAMTKKKPRKT